ncbi:uncharacterized protein LOC102803860 [Saccoglossus kowalevskii]|uniref:Uncharacterized protein LOC102803860 n=1 Tax=Saccoglossus kowalevskii TaxID=10224 RepID=A0ABM0MIK8_SACKO|nr:PREDICTED: uncharacterized protein LOC102803860 [Saccoglossus kowalevskii]
MAQVEGEAAKTIEGLQLSSANYKEALQLLKDRYGQPHKLISCHMTALWQLPKPNTTIVSIRSFYDSLETHIRGLKSLGKTEESYGELLVPIVLDKLPQSVKIQISREHGDKAWTITELKDALYKEIQANQAAINIGNEQYDNPIPTAATLHVGTRAKPKPCVFCQGSHLSGRCQVVSDDKTRMEILVKNKICFNCFGGKHRSTECWSKFSCRKCGKRHHTSICDASQKHGENTRTTTETPNTTHVNLTPTSGPTLLKTAIGNCNVCIDKSTREALFWIDVYLLTTDGGHAV